MAPSPMLRPALLLLLLLLVDFTDAGTVGTELIAPDFSASFLLFADTQGVFLRSSSGAFEAAVYNPASQQDRYYLAVLHAPSKTCVWAANRGAPITDVSALVRLTPTGISIEDANGAAIWSTPPFGSPVAALRLADTGNLALLDAANATLWQSFNVPTDTLVSSQRLPAGGSLSSALSASDMAEGDYSLSVTAGDAVLSWMGSSLYWRMSNDAAFVKDRDAAVAHMAVNGTGVFLLAADGTVIVQAAAMAPAGLRVVQLGVDGRLQIKSFASANSSSSPTDGGFVAPTKACDLPLSCGPLGLCTASGNASGCTCPQLFAAARGSGCAPSDGSSTLLPAGAGASCGVHGGVSYLSLGNGVAYYANKFSRPATAGSNASSCQALCTRNCSCLAYFYDHSSLSCYLARDRLGSFTNTNYSNGAHSMSGYVKVQSSRPQGSSSSDSSSSGKTLIAILLPTIIAFVLIVVVGAIVIASRRKEARRQGRGRSSRDVQLPRQRSPGSASAHLVHDQDVDGDDDDIVIPGLPTRFTHEEIEEMTNSFRVKIGAGGFGAVYKGELPDGSLVAVKKIEGVGMQGKREFCTEIAVIGNIHHVNLVRLRGFCTEGQRRLLVYEYMNRGSLERPLFRPAGAPLEWKERMDIAVGAARGLAYLHFGCNQRIIHCDVKPENILLADGGQVKIADFGLAKFLSPEQSGLFTTMRGTRGYLAPEWLTNTAITDRTDVYGFGMVLLELVHGRKNRSEHVSDGASGEDSNSTAGGGSSSRSVARKNDDYFPLAALEAHEAGRYEELADPRLEGKVVGKEVERMVKVALCCLHEDPQARPSMAVVAGMLEGTMDLAEPRAQALGFLRLYGRGYVSGPSSDGNDLKQMAALGMGDRNRSETTQTTMSGWPSYMSSSQLSAPR